MGLIPGVTPARRGNTTPGRRAPFKKTVADIGFAWVQIRIEVQRAWDDAHRLFHGGVRFAAIFGFTAGGILLLHLIGLGMLRR